MYTCAVLDFTSIYKFLIYSLFFVSRESNLKSRQSEEATNQMGEDEVALSQFNGHIICEPPNSNLSRFEGTMEWEGRKYAIGKLYLIDEIFFYVFKKELS